jgi:ribitol 2-dehydrogenase
LPRGSRDEAALKALREKHGDAMIPLVFDLLDAKSCATLMPQIPEKAGQLDILHANAGIYVGGDLVDANTDAIDRMLNLNVNVVMKNVHDVLPHMIERGTGDIVVTSSLAAHFPTPWEPVYASSKWAINCFVQTVRRQVFKHGIRVGSISPGPVISALLADWPHTPPFPFPDFQHRPHHLDEGGEVARAQPRCFPSPSRTSMLIRDLPDH